MIVNGEEVERDIQRLEEGSAGAAECIISQSVSHKLRIYSSLLA
jgi:hypothetical protein